MLQFNNNRERGGRRTERVEIYPENIYFSILKNGKTKLKKGNPCHTFLVFIHQGKNPNVPPILLNNWTSENST
jgi:hypothetical protein